MADGEAPRNSENVEFKKPVLIGRKGKLPKKATLVSDNSKASTTEQVWHVSCKGFSTEETDVKQSKNIPETYTKVIPVPIPYNEPKWSGLCPDGSDYAIEILKSGMILDRIMLTKQPYYVFGRLCNSHIVLTHPTISRHHAVLQYKAFAEEDPSHPPPGWYLFDLNSTHGTFHNGVRLKQEYYSRVRVGHQIKFGASSRAYILMGPDYDCEGESDLTVTEIKERAKQLKLDRERYVKEAIGQKERDQLEEEKKKEDQGIDWGLGEDAEEETDLADNPYAVAANEELFLDDPKKTLRGYFEREGHELSYDCEERGVGQFICRVELPMDDARGKAVVAEVIHRGKKKEAVVACALEACRILDRAGLLRQAKHEARRRKQRDWGADDYYDSDEDTFLDRTGSVESKRHNRMRKHGALPVDERLPKTHDDLLKDVAELERKISAEEKVLQRLRESGKQVTEEKSGEDALDAYMSSLGRQGQTMAQKAEISSAKLTIQKLKAELSKTQRLADLSRPADAPPLVKRDDKKLVKMSNSVVYGKRIKLKDDMDRKPKAKKEIKVEDTEFVEEMDSDDEENKSDHKKERMDESLRDAPRLAERKVVDNQIEKKDRVEAGKESKHVKMDVEEEEENDTPEIKGMNNESSTEHTTEVKRVFGPMRPPQNYTIPENYFDQETDRDLPEIEEKDIT